MSGRRSRRKGDNEERDVVNLHRTLGFDCERTLERGKRNDGSSVWDIDLNVSNDLTLTGECKVRGSGFISIYNYLGHCDFLTIRADRRPRLYVIREETWLLLLSSFVRLAKEEEENERKQETK